MTAPTKRAKPSHDEWLPSEGQRNAVNFLCSTATAALWADPGAGKTSITLAAFSVLRDRGQAQRMLVIAPLRVTQLVWRQEIAKWTQFRDMRAVLLHGPKKDQLLDAALADGTEIFLINYEGLEWLSNRYFGRQLPFDTIVADEITKLKNHASKRSKKLRPVTKRTPRKWGLTGTPAPNGYLDLFGQFLWLDGGQALGQYITHYRDMYFKPDFTGFDYVLQAGGGERIETRIAPSVFRLPYTDLPPLSNDVRLIEFDAKTAAIYKTMKKDMLAELPEGTVTAANAAAVYSKLSQMANGFVYLSDE
jgi:hypothetical protein